MTDNKKAPEPMDPTAPETKNPVNSHRERNAYALDTLIAEVDESFHDTTYDVSGRNGRNVALVVEFAPFETEAEDLSIALRAAADDPRIESVTVEKDPTLIVVTLRNNASTQDSREPFGLVDTLISREDES